MKYLYLTFCIFTQKCRYGFRSPPQFEIALKPYFGGHSLGKYEGTLSAVMKHLVKRLKQEFVKVLVYPNLDDIDIPFMDHISYSMGGSVHSSPTNSSHGKLETVETTETNANETQPQQQQLINNQIVDDDDPTTTLNVTVD